MTAADVARTMRDHEPAVTRCKYIMGVERCDYKPVLKSIIKTEHQHPLLVGSESISL